MTTLPLFHEHSGHHCAARRPGRFRRALHSIGYWFRTGEFLLPPEPFDPARAFEATRAGRMPSPVETEAATGEAPATADAGAIPPPVYPRPGSHPYPPAVDAPTMFPRQLGDGLIVLGPDGCIQIRRPEWASIRDTSYDMQTLPVVPRYLTEMPGGTE
jgi:hypothetical protein